MDLKTYAEQASRTMPILGSMQDDNMHMILGMVTEVGELADVFKKNMAYGKEIDWTNVYEELGDLMWYVINFCTANAIDLEAVLYTNVRKLETRYPEKFSGEAAINRDVQKERATLEGSIEEWE